MRGLTTPTVLARFMKEMAWAAQAPVNVYFTGGVTAILHGWRDSTIDIDLKMLPEADELLRALPRLKESLEVNVELAAPDHFIPALPGWQERSLPICQQGRVCYFHYDPYSQALAKIERGHSQDRADVGSMLEDGLIDRARLWEMFEAIEPDLYRYPAIHPASFRGAVAKVVAEGTG